MLHVRSMAGLGAGLCMLSFSTSEAGTSSEMMETVTRYNFTTSTSRDQMRVPADLNEALSMARALLTDEDRTVLAEKSVEETGWMLHMTLGFRLRNELGLWTDAAGPLYEDIMRCMPDRLAVDGDSASSALINALWLEYHRGDRGE